MGGGLLNTDNALQVEVLQVLGGSWHSRDVGFSLVPFGGLGGLLITEEKGGREGGGSQRRRPVPGVLGPEPSRLLPPSLT